MRKTTGYNFYLWPNSHITLQKILLRVIYLLSSTVAITLGPPTKKFNPWFKSRSVEKIATMLHELAKTISNTHKRSKTVS